MTDMELFDRLCEKAGFSGEFRRDEHGISLSVKAGLPVDGLMLCYEGAARPTEEKCLDAFFGAVFLDGTWFSGKAAPFFSRSRPELELKLEAGA